MGAWRISLTGILLHFILDYDQLDLSLLEHVSGILSSMVLFFGNHLGDPDADDQHRANPAGFHLAIQGASFERNPMFGGLTDRILLCMNGPHTMHPGRAVFLHDLLHQMSFLITMGKSRRGANISRADDLLAPDHDASAAAPVTGCTFAHLIHQS